MLIDARSLPAGEPVRAPVCVVGSGAAGITLAMELVEQGVDVVVLEGGGLRLEREAQDTYRGHLEDGTVHDALELVRQKRLGGTTGQWGGRCAPLQPIDFEARPWIPGSGWPIGLDDLLPHYRQAHHYCDLGRYEYSASDALDPVEPFVTAEGAAELSDDGLWRWSPPVKFGRRFRRALAEAPGAQVIHHANVVGLEREPGSGRIVRAVAASAPGRELPVEADVFVLAAGGLECARLLLASNRETPAGIGNEHDLVGRCYMTHPVAEVGEVRFASGERAAAGGFRRTVDGVYCRRMIRLDDDVQRRAGLRNLAAALWFPDPRDPVHGDGLLSAFALVRAGLARGRLDWKSAGVHARYRHILDVPAHVRNVARDLPEVARYGATWVGRRWLSPRALPSFMTGLGAGPVRLRFDAEQSPEPENRVTLTRDLDAFGVPRLALHYRVSDDDRASIVRSLRLIATEFERLGTGRMLVPDDERLADITFGDGTHQMGLTRMAASPRVGVVDRDCRVHGTANLFVASSSVFPTSGAVGPTLSVVALAVRLAATVAKELRAPATVDVPGPA